MKHNPDAPGQLALFAIAPTEEYVIVHDPYWDEIVAPEQDETEGRWNPTDFEEAEHKILVRAQVTASTLTNPVEPLTNSFVVLDTLKVAPEHNTHWVEKYWVERSNNKYWYYRYCWMSGRKKNRRHLGSITSIIAKRKKADIEVWIADGLTPVEISLLIQNWKHQPSTI